MSHSSQTVAAVLLSLALLVVAAPADAQSWRALVGQSSSTQQGLIDGRRSNQSNVRIGRNEAADIARGSVDGRVLNVRLRGDVYEVKILVAGERVRVVRVDARTGRIR